MLFFKVIWTSDMRNHLVQLVRDHLVDFPDNLQTKKSSRYEYCPIPRIHYERLHDEIFCHNYYLKNLCDEEFPDWPIHEPLSVFRACIQRWRDLQQNEGTEAPAFDDAKALLGLKDNANETELREAYCKAARKYHPDKVSP